MRLSHRLDFFNRKKDEYPFWAKTANNLKPTDAGLRMLHPFVSVSIDVDCHEKMWGFIDEIRRDTFVQKFGDFPHCAEAVKV